MALRDNWAGHEALRKKALAAPKWGNDDDRADAIFLRLFDEYCRWVEGQDNYLGEPYDPSMLAISPPSPSARSAGPFPMAAARENPSRTASLRPTRAPTPSARPPWCAPLKVDHTRIRGGLLNLKFHPTALSGERGSRNLLALIKTCFAGPGFHIQFNVVDSQMLRDAQAHPENYRDLVVRVAGSPPTGWR